MTDSTCEVMRCRNPAEVVVASTEYDPVEFAVCAEHADERTDEFADLEVVK